jgi:Zn-dependent membrane protease YugP
LGEEPLILKGAFLFSLFLFLGVTWILLRCKKFTARKRMNGYEVARYLLDQLGLSHFSIKPVTHWETLKKNPVHYFPIEKSLSEKNSLLAFSRIAQDILFTSRASASISLSWTRGFWTVWRFLIPLAWAGLIGCVFYPSWQGMRVIFLTVLGAALTVALIEISDVISANRQAYRLLKESGFFEIDELIRLRKILNALRFEGFTQIFKAPCDLISLLVTGSRIY